MQNLDFKCRPEFLDENFNTPGLEIKVLELVNIELKSDNKNESNR